MFQTSIYLGPGLDFLDIFSAKNDCIAVGDLKVCSESFRVGPNLSQWQLFKEGTNQIKVYLAISWHSRTS